MRRDSLEREENQMHKQIWDQMCKSWILESDIKMSKKRKRTEAKIRVKS